MPRHNETVSTRRAATSWSGVGQPETLQHRPGRVEQPTRRDKQTACRGPNIGVTLV